MASPMPDVRLLKRRVLARTAVPYSSVGRATLSSACFLVASFLELSLLGGRGDQSVSRESLGRIRDVRRHQRVGVDCIKKPAVDVSVMEEYEKGRARRSAIIIVPSHIQFSTP